MITVQQGKRYRFRVIGLSCDPSFNFSIEGHNFTVIEADAVDTEPVPANAVTVYAAQRYSVVVNANQPVSNYWIRAVPSDGYAQNTTGGVSSAILRYVGAPIAEPIDRPLGPGTILNEANLHALTDPQAPGGPGLGQADLVLPLALDFNDATNFTVNGVSYHSPPVPVLLQILTGANATNLLPIGSVYTLPKNKVIEIVLQGMPSLIAGPVRNLFSLRL